MDKDTAIVPVEQAEEIRLGSLNVNRPADVIVRASEVATQLVKIIKDQHLSRNISGRNYVYVDGWSTMGAMIGVLPREVSVTEHDSGDFEAVVELVRASDGAVVGRGSAIVGADEQTWNKRPRYARRSMAITRATGKAYRLGFSWIMSLAGYATTPAEEMDGVVEGEVVEEHHAPAPTNGKQSNPNGQLPASERPAQKLLDRWSALVQEAHAWKIDVDPIDPAKISTAELTERGKALKAAIERAEVANDTDDAHEVA